MPMMLARAIGDIRIQNAPNDAATDLHGVPGDDGGDQAERSVLMGAKVDGKVVQCAVGERQRGALDGDRDIV
jgi:hypothetical protein